MSASKHYTVGAWLDQPLPTVKDETDFGQGYTGVRPTTSSKAWTTSYDPGQWEVQSSSLISIEHPNNYGPLDESDAQRLGTSLNEDEQAWDTARLVLRHGIGPPPAVSLRKTAVIVDTTVLSSRSADEKASPAVIGEMKTPHVIDAKMLRSGWRSSSQGTNKLIAELRGYAHQYNTQDVFCFDYVHFLACIFDCNDREALKTCPIKMFIVPIDSQWPNVTVGRLLNHQIKRGEQRIRSSAAADDRCVVLGQRSLRDALGRAVWQDERANQISLGYPDRT
ncbi:hypothetical protein LTR10_002552 [Elasticomyces elasticus]|nr:hypothetical protein LTR10_002552 [Elasticomyces elasticus]